MNPNPELEGYLKQLTSKAREFGLFRIEEKLFRIAVLQAEIEDLNHQIRLLQAEIDESE